MPESELSKRMGDRMRKAAMRRDWNQTEVAELMERSTATISRWFSGEQTPDLEDMARYAALVGESEGYLWTGRRESSVNALANLVIESVLRVTDGQTLFDVHNRMTGHPEWMTAEQRRLMDAADGPTRDYVRRSVPNWDSLSEIEQRAALADLLGPNLPQEESPR